MRAQRDLRPPVLFNLASSVLGVASYNLIILQPSSFTQFNFHSKFDKNQK